MTFKKIDQESDIRPDGKTCILVFGYDAIALERIKTYAKSINNIMTIEVKADETNNTLRQLIDETGNVSKETTSHTSPAIILNAVSNAELNQFVHNFRSLGLQSPLFAMVTETSINWKFTDLLVDLLEERAMFHKMQQQKQSKEQQQ